MLKKLYSSETQFGDEKRKCKQILKNRFLENGFLNFIGKVDLLLTLVKLLVQTTQFYKQLC